MHQSIIFPCIRKLYLVKELCLLLQANQLVSHEKHRNVWQKKLMSSIALLLISNNLWPLDYTTFFSLSVVKTGENGKFFCWETFRFSSSCHSGLSQVLQKKICRLDSTLPYALSISLFWVWCKTEGFFKSFPVCTHLINALLLLYHSVSFKESREQ